jgi:hypothetical protein
MSMARSTYIYEVKFHGDQRFFTVKHEAISFIEECCLSDFDKNYSLWRHLDGSRRNYAYPVRLDFTL